MKKLNIALLSGGRSSEREVSLNSGRQVFQALDKAKYNVVCYDPLTDIPKLVAEASGIDMALIILHGPYGEDGTIQGLLQLLDIPFQGSGVLGSALSMNKVAAKRIYAQCGIPSPPYMAFSKYQPQDIDHCIRKLGFPMIVKPVEAGSSVGMALVRSPEEFDSAMTNAFLVDRTVLVEAFVQGTEITVAVLGNEELTPLPPVEIIPNKGYDFFDYTAKYQMGETQEICPARIDDRSAAKAMDYAVKAHQALFCKGYSRTDMICSDGEIFVLETNTIPGMTRTSLLPLAAQTAGINFTQLLDRLIELGLEAHHSERPYSASPATHLKRGNL